MTEGKQRTILGTVIFLGLAAATTLILGFVDATAMVGDSKRCALSIWPCRWFSYIGCTMAAHEGLAGGLIALDGAIWAAWLAYTGIQEQIAAERRARNEQRSDEEKRGQQRAADAKRAAIVCITPTVRAAAAAMFSINKALTDGKKSYPVQNAFTHLETTLGSFTIREAVRDLAIDDRTKYLEIVGHLSTLASVSKHGASKPGRERYSIQKRALTKLSELLKQFDPGLAAEFHRVSEVAPPREQG